MERAAGTGGKIGVEEIARGVEEGVTEEEGVDAAVAGAEPLYRLQK